MFSLGCHAHRVIFFVMSMGIFVGVDDYVEAEVIEVLGEIKGG